MKLKFDPFSIAGAALVPVVALLLYFLLAVFPGEATHITAFIVGILLLVSPFFVISRIYRLTGDRIFSDFNDFLLVVAWAPLTLLIFFINPHPLLILAVATCGILADSVLLRPRRFGYPGQVRFMTSYSRVLSGIIGTFLMVTFIGKLMDIGNPRNKRNIAQEIFSTIMWGYMGKSFFDFIGVTKPINIGSPVPGWRRP